MSLISALPTLQQDIKDILYRAAYESVKVSQEQGEDTNSNIQRQLDAELDRLAVRFAKKFSEEVYKDLGEAIYNFVKEIGIMMTPEGTLIAPTMGGPVTGTATMNNFTII